MPRRCLAIRRPDAYRRPSWRTDQFRKCATNSERVTEYNEELTALGYVSHGEARRAGVGHA